MMNGVAGGADSCCTARILADGSPCSEVGEAPCIIGGELDDVVFLKVNSPRWPMSGSSPTDAPSTRVGMVSV